MTINRRIRASIIVIALISMAAVARGEDRVAPEATAAQYATGFTMVEVDSKMSPQMHLAVQACAGLKNRKLGGSIFVNTESADALWLDELGLKPDSVVSAEDFLDSCGTEFASCVRYSYDDQQELLPSILTAASVLEALPLDLAMNTSCGEVAFDAVAELKDNNTPYLATKYAFEHFADKTTGLAMLNPGYDMNPEDFSKPGLTSEMQALLVDFVFSRKLFVVFLVNGCVDGNEEKEILSKVVNAGIWPTPVGVYGYNNSWGVAGYLYEAQTRCLDSRNMGAIPTMTSNLSFFSTRRPPIQDAKELQRNEPEEIEYDPAKTYVAFVVGDGDNVRFIMTSRKEWLRQRLADCEKPENSCAPLTWSISPHLANIAPDVLQWYYSMSKKTGKDYFILPPSGHLYSYPTSLEKDDQKRFILATEHDARILGVTGVVHWDWFDTWMKAEKSFLPKYARASGSIRGVFPVNVPYMFPTFTWWPKDQFFKALEGKDGSKVVVFCPREWRGVSGKAERTGDEPFQLTPESMAEELAGYPPGTVTWVYMTSDGGLNLENSFMALVKILPPNVQIVSADAAAKLAVELGK